MTFRSRVLDSSAGTGSVTSVSVTTHAGVSGSVANPSTTPAISITLGAITPSSITVSGNETFTTAASGPILKRGANGRVGTFVADGVTPVDVANTSVAITDCIIISLNTPGGTVGALPVLQTITASTGFTVIATALDTSTYNYAIIKNAA